MSKSRDTVESIRTALLDADIGTSVLAPDGDGSNLTGINAVVVGSTLPSDGAAAASLFYQTSNNKLYISDGSLWGLVANKAPQTTGGTVVISSVSELSGSYSYNLGIDFTDDVSTDAQLTYTLESGSLPTGCVLPSSGNSSFTGTIPAVSANTLFNFIIRAADPSGESSLQTYQQSIINQLPVTTGGTVTLTSVVESNAASYDVDTDFTFSSGSVFSAYSLFSGTLPTGTSLNTSTGVISGTASHSGSYSFSIRATAVDGGTSEQSYTWPISTVAPTSTGGTITISGADGLDAVSYDADTDFTFSAGSTFSAYSIGSGAIPSGTSLNTSTGVISGTASNSSTTYTFAIRATDTDGDTVDQNYSWTITQVVIGEAVFSSAGNWTWVCPAGVSSVAVVCVGGGGGGMRDQGSGPAYNGIDQGYGGHMISGQGGSLGWKNSISVTAGTTYVVTVGDGGAYGNSDSAAGSAGGASQFISSGTVSASGGLGGTTGTQSFQSYTGDGGGSGGLGATNGGGMGGAGGGGAGGYSGNGGEGKGHGTTTGLAGRGGGGGGGGGSANSFCNSTTGGGGGGVGLSGQGGNGGLSQGTSTGGYGGSGGGRGNLGNTSNTGSGYGGIYGGGGGSGRYCSGARGGNGGVGGVRIIYGPNRSFPSNAT